jgi:hypothetical protein
VRPRCCGTGEDDGRLLLGDSECCGGSPPHAGVPADDDVVESPSIPVQNQALVPIVDRNTGMALDSQLTKHWNFGSAAAAFLKLLFLTYRC